MTRNPTTTATAPGSLLSPHADRLVASREPAAASLGSMHACMCASQPHEELPVLGTPAASQEEERGHTQSAQDSAESWPQEPAATAAAAAVTSARRQRTFAIRDAAYCSRPPWDRGAAYFLR